jgi:hypothetical protein
MSTMILEGDTIASTKIRVDLYLSYLDISINDVWPCALERQLPSYVTYFRILLGSYTNYFLLPSHGKH